MTAIGRTLPARMNSENIRATFQSVIDINTSTQPSIFGLKIIHGHYCIVSLSDGRKYIKVVDTRSEQVTSTKCIRPVNVWGLTPLIGDRVAVSVESPAGNFKIRFFKVSASGVIMNTYSAKDVNDYYRDMVYCNGKLYGVCEIGIDIMSIDGTFIERIGSAAIFRSLRRIAIAGNGQTIYVTDYARNSVISLTLSGNVNAIYTHDDLKQPSGITVIGHGDVFVRSSGTSNIHQLNANLENVRVLIEDVHGDHITFSAIENKIYLSDRGNIKVYSLNLV